MLQLAKTSEDGAKTVPPISKFSSYCEYDTFDYRKLNGWKVTDYGSEKREESINSLVVTDRTL